MLQTVAETTQPPPIIYNGWENDRTDKPRRTRNQKLPAYHNIPLCGSCFGNILPVTNVASILLSTGIYLLFFGITRVKISGHVDSKIITPKVPRLRTIRQNDPGFYSIIVIMTEACFLDFPPSAHYEFQLMGITEAER